MSGMVTFFAGWIIGVIITVIVGMFVRVIAPVYIDMDAGIWPKTHSPHDVFLAARMKISSYQWSKRINLI